MIKGENERLLFEILNDAYPGKWKSEFQGIEGRKYRFDAASTDFKLAVEINGGIHPFYMTLKNGKQVLSKQSGHSSTAGIERDYDKINAATLSGWKVLIYTPETLRKSPWKIMKDIRTLCGIDGASQAILNFDGCIQQKIESVQVKLGE